MHQSLRIELKSQRAQCAPPLPTHGIHRPAELGLIHEVDLNPRFIYQSKILPLEINLHPQYGELKEANLHLYLNGMEMTIQIKGLHQ